jgi:hypothetical protein
MRKRESKLALSRETLHLLSPEQAQAAVAGATTGTSYCSYTCPTYFCHT